MNTYPIGKTTSNTFDADINNLLVENTATFYNGITLTPSYTAYDIILSPGTPSQNYTFTLPPTPGSSGQVLTTNGSGVTSWISAGSGGIGTVTSVGLTSSLFTVTGSPITTSGTFTVDPVATTGTGTTIVLSAGPTLTGTTTVGKLAVNGTQASTIEAFDPAMVAGTRSMYLGRSTTAKDGAQIDYVYVSSGSTSNYLQLGLSGTPLVRIYNSTSLNTFASSLGTMNSYRFSCRTIVIGGDLSFPITLDGSAGTGTYSFRFPATAGTTGQIFTSGGGASANTWTSTTGTGTVVLSASPTLTGTTTFDKIAVVASASGIPIDANYSGMSAIATRYIYLGRAASTNDSVTLGFNSTASGSTSNFVSLGLFGTGGLRVYPSATYAVDSAGTTTAYAMASNYFILNANVTNKVTLDASGASTPYSFKFPATAGTAGQVLVSQGSGTMTWGTAYVGTVTSFGLASSLLTFTGTNPITYYGTIDVEAVTTGTGTEIVLSASPTLTGTTTMTTAVVSGSYNVPIAANYSGMVNGSIRYLFVGRSQSVSNCAVFEFDYVSSSSNSNYTGVGLYGASQLKVYPYISYVVPGSGSVAANIFGCNSVEVTGFVKSSTPNCSIFNLTTNFTIPSGTYTTVQNWVAVRTNGEALTISGTNSIFTNNLGRSIAVTVSYSSSISAVSGNSEMYIIHSGFSTLYGHNLVSYNDNLTGSATLYLLNGDSFKIQALQFVGGAVTAGSTLTYVIH